MKEAVEEYMELGFVGKSAGTKRAYERPLRVLVSVTGERMHVKNLDSTHIDRALLRSLRKEDGGLAPTVDEGGTGGRSLGSLNIDKTAYRRFVAYMQRSGYFHGKTSPVTHLLDEERAPDPEKKKPLDVGIAGKVLQLAGDGHPRDRMAVALVLFTGLRLSEITALTWGQIKWDSREIHCRRRKNKDIHKAYFTPDLEKELRAWWQIYHERHGNIDDNWYVIPGRLHGKYRSRFDRMNPEWPMTPHRPVTNLYSCLKPLLAEAGVTDLKGKAWHTLRRTFANQFYEAAGKDIRAVQAALGHKNQKTTEIYMDKDEQQEKNKETLATWSLFKPPTQRSGGNVIDLSSRRQQQA